MLPDGAVPVSEGATDEAGLSRAARAAGVGEPAEAEEFDVGIAAAEVPEAELDNVELSSTAARAAGVGVTDGAAELKVGAPEAELVPVSSRAVAARLGVAVGEVGLAVF